MGSATGDVAVRFKKSVNVFQSELNESPKNIPRMIAAGFARLFSVSEVGIANVSCPKRRKGRRVYPGGGVTMRNMSHSTSVVTTVTMRKTRPCARNLYQ